MPPTATANRPILPGSGTASIRSELTLEEAALAAVPCRKLTAAIDVGSAGVAGHATEPYAPPDALAGRMEPVVMADRVAV